MSIYSKLGGIRKLSNSSLTSIVDVTNLNFRSLSDATLGFLNNIKYNESTNSLSSFKGSFDHVDISNTLSLKVDGIPTFTINTHGKATGRELLVVVSESKRHRFTDFNDWPETGVPGEVIYTGVQNQQPGFGEDFIGYLSGRGWVSLTNLTAPVDGLYLLPEVGSPIVIPTVPNGQGLVWIGPPGSELNYNPVNTTVYFTDDDGNTFDILQDFAWDVIGANAKFKLQGKAVIGDSSNIGKFQYVDGNETPGYILTSDGAGNANWAPNSGANTIGATNLAYWETTSFTSNIAETIIHDLGTLNVVLNVVDVTTNESVEAHIDNYQINSFDVTLSDTNPNIKIVVMGAGASLSSTSSMIMSPDDKFLVALDTTTDGDLASNNGITNTPIDGCYVVLYINGQEIEVGNGIATKSCFLANSATPTIPKGFSSGHVNGQVTSGDKIYWNGSIAGFELNTTDRISLHYLTV